MKTYTIAQKMSGTGSIHDLASDQHDRVIKFRAGTTYAVVLAAYYGGKGYTTHYTAEEAARQSHKLCRRGYDSHGIIDVTGQAYTAHYDNTLIKD